MRNKIRDSIMAAHPVLSDRMSKTPGEEKKEGDQSGQQSQIAEELARKYEDLED
jgi:hypothetical protein